MKKKINLLAIVAVVMTTGIFANPIQPNVNNQVMTSFASRFEGAKDVSWNRADQYVKASFVKDEQAMSAYFEITGEFIGVSRNIISLQLPINLNTELKKLLTNGWITELFEFSTNQEISYFVTVENADQKIHFKSAGSNDWSIYRRTKKS